MNCEISVKPWPNDRNMPTQHIATMLAQHVACDWPPCCDMLRHFQTGANNTQHVATHCNTRTVAKRTQHVAICCLDMLRFFGWGLRVRVRKRKIFLSLALISPRRTLAFQCAYAYAYNTLELISQCESGFNSYSPSLQLKVKWVLVGR